MKIVHIADLHLGKKLCGYDIVEDQRHILDEILRIIDDERPEAVVIAGDVYDSVDQTKDATRLFDRFLVELSKKDLKTFVISGNHDSAVRLSFGNRLMDKSGVYIAPEYDGHVEPIPVEDEFGTVWLYMLPFVNKSSLKQFFPGADMSTESAAMKAAVDEMDVSPFDRNVLVAHLYVSGAIRCDSETKSVGGADNVDPSVFDAFDYVALGHLHTPQSVTPTIRYAGSPVAYSISEVKIGKSVTVAEIGERGELSVREVPLKPLHGMADLKGTYAHLTSKDFLAGTTYRDDYVRIILTDEMDVPDANFKLRAYYDRIMNVDYDNARTRAVADMSGPKIVETKALDALFEDFFEACYGGDKHLSDEQKKLIEKIASEIEEEDR